MIRRLTVPNPRVIRALLLGLLSAGVLGGCVTPSVTKATETTKPDTASAGDPAFAEYRKKADTICKETRQRMAPNLAAFETHESVAGRARRKTVKVATPVNVGKYVSEQIGQLERQQLEISKLPAPTSDAGKQVQALWAQANTVIAAVKADPQGIYKDPFKPMATSLKDLGFNDCLQSTRP
jgi:hypothetical protein